MKANTAAFFCTVCCAVIGFTSVGERPPLFPVSRHLRVFAALPRLLGLGGIFGTSALKVGRVWIWVYEPCSLQKLWVV